MARAVYVGGAGQPSKGCTGSARTGRPRACPRRAGSPGPGTVPEPAGSRSRPGTEEYVRGAAGFRSARVHRRRARRQELGQPAEVPGSKDAGGNGRSTRQGVGDRLARQRDPLNGRSLGRLSSYQGIPSHLSRTTHAPTVLDGAVPALTSWHCFNRVIGQLCHCLQRRKLLDENTAFPTELAASLTRWHREVSAVMPQRDRLIKTVVRPDKPIDR